MLKHNILLKYSCPIYWRRCEFGQSRRSRVLSISDLCVFAQFCYDWALGEWLRNGTAGLMKTKAILLNPSCYKWGIKAGILASQSTYHSMCPSYGLMRLVYQLLHIYILMAILCNAYMYSFNDTP